MDEDIKDFLEIMNRGCYDLKLFNLYMRPEESFTYSNNAKAIVMVVETIQSLTKKPIDEKKWNEFKNHPSNRMRLLV